MHVVEIERSLERGLGRAGEEIQAAVEGQDIVGLFHHRGHRGEAEHVVVAGPAGNLHQHGGRVFHATRVDVPQVDSARGCVFHGVQGRGAIQAFLVDIGHHHQRRPAVVAMQGIVDGGQAHRTHTGQQGHLAALFDLHGVHVRARMRMVVGVHGANHAGKRLAQRGGVEPVAGILQQAAFFHHLVRDDDVGGVAAGILVGITRGAVQARRTDFVVDGRLDGELVSGFELILPFLAHGDNLARELVADDDRFLGDVAGHPLVGIGLMRSLIGRHTDGIADDFGEDFVFARLRQLEGFESEVVFSVQSDSSGLHILDY